MRNSQSKWQTRIIQFMRGRYGRIDILGKHMLILGTGLMILNMFLRTRALSIPIMIILLVVYYRVFSKKIYVRSNENQKYLLWWNKLKKPFAFRSAQFKQRKEFRLFICGECKQHVRVPKKRGKIMITCPNCHNKFEKRT